MTPNRKGTHRKIRDGRFYSYRRCWSDSKDCIQGRIYRKKQSKEEKRASLFKKANDQFFGPLEEYDDDGDVDEDEVIWFAASSEGSYEEDLTWNQQFWPDQPSREEEGFEDESSYTFDVDHKFDESDGSLIIHTGKLLVSALDQTVTEEKLSEYFSYYGEIVSVIIQKDEENRSLGFGYVNFSSAKDAALCKAMLDNTEWHDSVLQIGFNHEDCSSVNDSTSSSGSSAASPSQPSPPTNRMSTGNVTHQENANHHEEECAPAPDVVAPVTQDVVAPVTQDVVAPVTQDVVAPVTPDVVATVTPEVVAPVAQAREIVPVVEKNIPEDAAVSTEESQVKEVVHVVKEKVTPVQEEAPVSEVVNKVQDSSIQVAVEINAKAEDQPKTSYASVVMKLNNNVVPFSSPVSAPKKPQPKKKEQPPVNNAPTTVVAAEPVASSVESVQNGSHEEEAEGYSVYIKGLPINVTHAMLEEEFKKFGPIKPNGIQVRSNRMQGFSFGFVEFEVPEAVQKAIEASPIPINGRNAVVEEKRSTTSRGGYRGGRFVGGRGPGIIRNDNMRGRGNYGGGRGYNRGPDFGGNRNDYGYRGGNSRGGASNRGGGAGYEKDNGGGC